MNYSYSTLLFLLLAFLAICALTEADSQRHDHHRRHIETPSTDLSVANSDVTDSTTALDSTEYVELPDYLLFLKKWYKLEIKFKRAVFKGTEKYELHKCRVMVGVYIWFRCMKDCVSEPALEYLKRTMCHERMEVEGREVANLCCFHQ
ncbi:unnamed protein product [Caenorhabditis brenneri]